MTGNPLVSVIINCYNGENYLREAIDSVIAQTYENWEIIFWDNQSTDSTREIVESYHNSKIHYYYAQEHTPLGEARNLAVEKANGEYINFLDADDVWMPKKLEKQIEAIVPGKVETVITGYDLIADKKSQNGPLYEAFLYCRNQKKQQVQTLEDFLYGRGPMTVFSSVLFNRSIYKKVGGINSKFEQNEDFDIIIKSATQSNIGYVNGVYTLYRLHNNNNSKVNGVLGYLENREIFEELPDSPSLRRAININETRIAAYAFWEKKSLNILFNDIVMKGRSLLFISLLVKKIERKILALCK